MDKENVRPQNRATRIVGRVMMVLALVAGIAAMHTAIDTPMTVARTATSAQAESMSMHSLMAAPAGQPSSDATHAGVTPVLAVTGLMSHAMHACLFLAAGLLFLLLPAFGNKLPFSAPRLAAQRRQDFAVRTTDQTLTLQVLRI